jgi:hypothetical protein
MRVGPSGGFTSETFETPTSFPNPQSVGVKLGYLLNNLAQEESIALLGKNVNRIMREKPSGTDPVGKAGLKRSLFLTIPVFPSGKKTDWFGQKAGDWSAPL